MVTTYLSRRLLVGIFELRGARAKQLNAHVRYVTAEMLIRIIAQAFCAFLLLSL